MHCEAEPIVLCCAMLCCVWWGVCARSLGRLCRERVIVLRASPPHRPQTAFRGFAH